MRRGVRVAGVVAMLCSAVCAPAVAQSDAERADAVLTVPVVSNGPVLAPNVCLVSGHVQQEDGGGMIADGFGCDWKEPIVAVTTDQLAVSVAPAATGVTLSPNVWPYSGLGDDRACSAVSAGSWMCDLAGITAATHQQLGLDVDYPYGSSYWTFDVDFPPLDAPVPPDPPPPAPPRISSGGDVAGHVCRATSACTLIFVPLRLSRGDRIDVEVDGRPSALRIGPPGIAPPVQPCRRVADGRWRCRMPEVDDGTAALRVRVEYPHTTVDWRFDVMILPRGQRATDRRRRVRFRLAGWHLRVQLLPKSSARGEVLGRRVTAVCHGRRGRRIETELTWPKGVGTRGFFFKEGWLIEARACLIEGRNGRDIARVRFPRR